MLFLDGFRARKLNEYSNCSFVILVINFLDTKYSLVRSKLLIIPFYYCLVKSKPRIQTSKQM